MNSRCIQGLILIEVCLTWSVVGIALAWLEWQRLVIPAWRGRGRLWFLMYFTLQEMDSLGDKSKNTQYILQVLLLFFPLGFHGLDKNVPPGVFFFYLLACFIYFISTLLNANNWKQWFMAEKHWMDARSPAARECSSVRWVLSCTALRWLPCVWVVPGRVLFLYPVFCASHYSFNLNIWHLGSRHLTLLYKLQ